MAAQRLVSYHEPWMPRSCDTAPAVSYDPLDLVFTPFPRCKLRPFILAAASAAAMVAASCASPPPAVNSGPEPAPTATIRDSVPTALRPIRWYGTLSAVQTRSGFANQPSVRTKASGRVDLESVGPSQSRARARITVTDPSASGSDLRWALLPGRCGSSALPLVGYDVFPAIELSSNRRGELDIEIPVGLPSGGSLHVNIYSYGQQLSEVVACANLRRDES